jgi:Mu transposase, C-terminal domain
VARANLGRPGNERGTGSAASAVGRPVEIRAYADRIELRPDGRVVGQHPRCFGRDQTVFDAWHYVPVLARKPGALRNGAPFKDWALPAGLQRIRRKLTAPPPTAPKRRAASPNPLSKGVPFARRWALQQSRTFLASEGKSRLRSAVTPLLRSLRSRDGRRYGRPRDPYLRFGPAPLDSGKNQRHSCFHISGPCWRTWE